MIAAMSTGYKRRDSTWYLSARRNEEARKENIDGAQAWKDLDDREQIKERGWKVEAFFGKAKSSKAWG